MIFYYNLNKLQDLFKNELFKTEFNLHNTSISSLIVVVMLSLNHVANFHQNLRSEFLASHNNHVYDGYFTVFIGE